MEIILWSFPPVVFPQLLKDLSSRTCLPRTRHGLSSFLFTIFLPVSWHRQAGHSSWILLCRTTHLMTRVSNYYHWGLRGPEMPILQCSWHSKAESNLRWGKRLGHSDLGTFLWTLSQSAELRSYFRFLLKGKIPWIQKKKIWLTPWSGGRQGGNN